jgi:hypothetical protein
MTLSVSTVMQALIWLANVLNIVLPVVQDPWKTRLSVALAIVSITMHQLAGRTNPDGTPASVAYIPPTRSSGASVGEPAS